MILGEVAVKAVEIGAKAAETTAKAAEKTAEVGSKVINTEKGVDITKRVDISKSNVDGKPESIDIRKRITSETVNQIKDVSAKDLSEIIKDYISELKTKSECGDTILTSALDKAKWEVQSPEKVAELREQFDDNKAKLRKEWESLNNREWPKYKEDVYNEKGVRIRKAGDNYDAHHIQPLKLGGANEASNITPLDLTKHADIHSVNGSCTKLVNGIEGVSR